MYKISISDTARIMRCAFFFGLMILLLFPAVEIGTASEDVRGRINSKKTELSEVIEQISKLESDIQFELAWDKKLAKAESKLAMVKASDSELGNLFRQLADKLSAGASENTIREMIAEANSKLEPYFRVDEKGNLQWGSSLQLAGIQAQFIPGQMTALTPESALEVVKEWAGKNNQKMGGNKEELNRLDNRKTRLNAELTQLKEDERQQFASRLNELTNSLSGLEAESDSLVKKNAEIMKSLEKIKKLIDRISTFGLELESLQNYYFAEQEIDLRSDDLPNSIETITAEMESLQKAYDAQSNALEEVGRVRDFACEDTPGEAASTTPGAGDIESRIASVRDRIVQAGLAMKLAIDGFKNQSDLLWRKTLELQSKIQKLEGDRVRFLMLIKTLRESKNEFEALSTEAKGLETWLKDAVQREPEPLQQLKEKFLSLRVQTRSLLVSARGTSMENEVSALLERIDSGIEMPFTATDPAVIPKLPDFSVHSAANLAEYIDSTISNINVPNTVLKMDDLIGRGSRLVADVQGVVAAGTLMQDNALGHLEAARSCLASLEEAMNASQVLVSDARAAIDSCDFDRAKSLIDTMEDGIDKTELVTAYTEARNLEDELKSMVNTDAKDKYNNCDFDGALEILRIALPKAKCKIHKDKIEKSISLAEEGKKYETELKKMVNQDAKGKFELCDYSGAIEILQQALPKAKCESHIDKIIKSMTLAEKGMELEPELKKMVNIDAKEKYKRCDFDGAIEVLRDALPMAKCQTHKDKINKSIGLAEKGKQLGVELNSAIEDILRNHQDSSAQKTLDDLNALRGKFTCADHTERINEAIAKVRSGSSASPLVQTKREKRAKGAYSCEFNEYRDPINPNKAGTIITDEQESTLIFHITNNRDKCKELSPGASGWGQTTGGSIICDFVAGNSFNDTVKAAKRDCAAWLEKKNKAQAVQPANCRIVYGENLSGYTSGSWECVCDSGKPTKEVCCAAPAASAEAARTLDVYRGLSGCPGEH